MAPNNVFILISVSIFVRHLLYLQKMHLLMVFCSFWYILFHEENCVKLRTCETLKNMGIAASTEAIFFGHPVCNN